jgi:hypothetical protein
MKMPPDLVKAQGNMAPGVITADGFLGSDKRPLVDIIEADEEKMRTLGLDFQEVSEKMDRLLKEGRRGLGDPITVEEKWLVRTDEARGFLPCPFEDGVFRKVTATVVHRATGQKLVYSDLSLHLLDKHHFLQGYGAAFRIEPAAVGKVLEL